METETKRQWPPPGFLRAQVTPTRTVAKIFLSGFHIIEIWCSKEGTWNYWGWWNCNCNLFFFFKKDSLKGCLCSSLKRHHHKISDHSFFWLFPNFGEVKTVNTCDICIVGLLKKSLDHNTHIRTHKNIFHNNQKFSGIVGLIERKTGGNEMFLVDNFYCVTSALQSLRRSAETRPKSARGHFSNIFRLRKTGF